jgi:hypothetical protein
MVEIDRSRPLRRMGQREAGAIDVDDRPGRATLRGRVEAAAGAGPRDHRGRLLIVETGVARIEIFGGDLEGVVAGQFGDHIDVRAIHAGIAVIDGRQGDQILGIEQGAAVLMVVILPIKAF